ncbi:MAG: TonB-dependent receptor plug domain-containing protein [Spirosomaceae bacterium]|jgi:TonB-dependent SusC/RagA subfamily outer membrane receptor|nr:TonB-dependent receptor plug domain-containing protein [Spirosomataceae bacterium]
MSRHSLSFALFALVTSFFAFRFEDDFLQKIGIQLDRYQRQTPHEKVYLHLDRPYYTAGETLWMKAYVVFATDLQPDTLSRVLYVDLVHKQQGKLIVSKKLKIQNGLAYGDITLGDSLVAGDYQLRAYTHFMRNFSEEFFFRRDLRILRTDTAPKTLPNVEDVDFQLFPEGGQLVENIESRIAFKAVNPLSQGVKVEGFVLNQANDTIVGFTDEHLGMGSFNFKPEPAQQYRVQIKKPNGQFAVLPFPKVESQGFVLMVDNLSNKENVRIFVRNNLPTTTTPEEIALVAHNQGVVSYAAKTPATKKSMLFSIPRSKMGDGISCLTLFDAKGRPLCERLVFVNAQKPLDIQITANKNSYAPREKVEVEINVKDAEGKPVAGSFSLAATDVGQVLESPQAQTIVSYLRMEGDLRGYIEQPMGYFDPKNTNAPRQMDVLLMTQGWRRFEWKEVLRDTPTDIQYMIEQGISMTGKVLRPNGKAPGKVKLTFMLRQRDSAQVFLMGESIETGEFAAYNIDVKDTVQVLIQASNNKGNRNFAVNLDPYLAAPVTLTKVPFNPMQFDSQLLAEYLKRAKEYLDIERRIRESREKLLQEVVIKGKREELFPDSRRALYTSPSNTLKFDDTNTAGAMTIFDVIQSRIPGVQVSGSGMDRTVQIRGAANFSGVVEPTFVLDGNIVSKDAIMTIPPFDVEAVDVLKGAEASIYGSQGAGGVIAVLTKRGNPNYDFGSEKAEGTLVTKILGYSSTREFYAPRYDKPIPEHVRPDFRATLHWAHSLQTDSTGRAKTSFFASDAKTDLQLSLEGMSQTGIVGAGSKRVKVQ